MAEAQPEYIKSGESDDNRRRLMTVARYVGKQAVKKAVPVVGAVLGTYLALHGSSYETNIAGLPTNIRVVNESGVRAHTTFGDIEFEGLDGLPIGLEVDPTITSEALQAVGQDAEAYKQTAVEDLKSSASSMGWYFGGRAVGGGALGGIGAVGALYGAEWLVRGKERGRRQTVKDVGMAAGIGVLTCGLVGGYGWATFDMNNVKNGRVTAMLAEVDTFRDTFTGLNARDSSLSAIDGGISQVDALLSIRDAIVKPIEAQNSPPSAMNVMFISDMHLRNMYPFIKKVAEVNHVDLTINTGDETAKGTPYDFTVNPGYLKSVANLAATTPMVWVKGNHDSDENAATMDKIPNVYVLNKQIMQVDGLWIGGMADPRYYGDNSPALGDAEAEFEQQSTEKVLAANPINKANSFDIFMDHETPSAETVREAIPDRARWYASGHTHQQNPINELQDGNGSITTTEGSTGMGGIVDGMKYPVPLELSIAQVSANCQFLSIKRYQLTDPSLSVMKKQTDSSSISVTTFKPQNIQTGRRCGPNEGVMDPVSWTKLVQESGEATLLPDDPQPESALEKPVPIPVRPTSAPIPTSIFGFSQP